jgi:hypothetical protein
MAEESARFALPFIIPGQAQKELFHNEAIARIDIAIQPAVEGSPAGEPPTAPADGECWIVAAAPTGAWSQHAGEIACWTDGGWRFVAPQPGMSAWNKAASLPMVFDGSSWRAGELLCSEIRIGGLKVLGTRQPHVPSPSGGTIIDTEARAAIEALAAALMSHGLIE